MPKQIVDGSEFFDGQKVAVHQGRFTGKFDLDEPEGVSISTGDQCTFMVTVRAASPKFTTDPKTGALRRENTFRMESASLIDPDQARFLYDSMDLYVEGVNTGLIEAELGFDSKPPTSPPEASNGVSGTSTPESGLGALESHTGASESIPGPERNLHSVFFGETSLFDDLEVPHRLSFQEVSI